MQDIYILGSGAMGYLWASYFTGSANLHFITRNKITDHFSFEKQPGNIHTKACKVTPAVFASNQQTIQKLIICTKAFDAQDALASVQPYLSSNCEIILIQNGMGSQQAISNLYPHMAIYACSSTEGVYKKSEGILIHAGQGENHIGALTDTANQKKLSSWLPKTVYHWHKDIHPVLWRKLVINCAINPLTVIYHCQNGELLTNPIAFQHMKDVCAELDNLCETLGLSLTPTLSLAETICQSTANNYSSMYQDAHNNRQTEIEFITGYVIQQCDELGINCPTNKSTYNQISS